MEDLIKKIKKIESAAKAIQKKDCAVSCSPEARRLKDIIKKTAELGERMEWYKKKELPLSEQSKRVLDYSIEQLQALKKETMALPTELLIEANT